MPHRTSWRTGSTPVEITKILLVDDEPDLLTLLSYNLKAAGFDVATAEDGTTALKQAERMRPDLILLDIMMPNMDGFEVCKALRRHPDLYKTPILFLSSRGDEMDQMKGLELGADDYIVKPVSPSLLISRIQAFLRRTDSGSPAADPMILRFEDLVIDRHQFTVSRMVGGRVRDFHFPRKEFELLFFMANRPGYVFTREDLLTALWHQAPEVTPRTIDVHIRKIRRKLGADAIETVTGVGYRFRGA
jgi:two-component system alkaline phosphatase synthesis response regulator PhoP